MKIRRRILILMMLTWPLQSYAQSRAPSPEPYTVGSWFGAMGDDLVYALEGKRGSFEKENAYISYFEVLGAAIAP